jgi:hypothetical protein
VPLLVAAAAMVGCARVVHRPRGALATAGWYLALLVVSWLVARVVSRVVDRSLPLAALLELSLSFPETAPTRLGLAQRNGSASALASLATSPPDNLRSRRPSGCSSS